MPRAIRGNFAVAGPRLRQGHEQKGAALGKTASTAWSRLIAVCFCAITLSTPAPAQLETRGSFLALTNSETRSIAVGDFNHDGKPDLAVVSSCCPIGGVSILLGNGDGTFRPPVDYAAGVQPFSIVAVDLNHDGNLDLAIADSRSQYFYILLGNGDGTFEKASRGPGLPRNPEMIQAGDFNGDGIPDIVTASYGVISLTLGNGDGTFQPPIDIPPPTAVESIGVGDFNGDGNLDLAEAGTFGSESGVTILLGKGDGTFDDGNTYPTDTSPESIAIADLNADHNLDLAIANSEGGSIDVLLGNGDGTFESPAPYAIPFCVWVTVADVNGDGKADLVTAADYDLAHNISGAGILLGNGDGTFQDPIYYQGNSYATSNVVVSDFNGDGKADLVITNFAGNNVLEMLNTGVVGFSPTTPLMFKKQAIGTKSAAQKVTLTNSGTMPLKISSMKVSGQFGVTSTCGKSVPAGANCSISVTFSPQSKGLKSGTVTINDSASSKPMVIELSGTGT
jgi:hypothetical protein